MSTNPKFSISRALCYYECSRELFELNDDIEFIHLLNFSRTRILRHMAAELNLNMRSDGYVRVQDLLKLNMKTFANIPLRSHTVDDIREVGSI